MDYIFFFTQSDREHECLHVCVFIIVLMFGVKCVWSPQTLDETYEGFSATCSSVSDL